MSYSLPIIFISSQSFTIDDLKIKLENGRKIPGGSENTMEKQVIYIYIYIYLFLLSEFFWLSWLIICFNLTKDENMVIWKR